MASETENANLVSSCKLFGNLWALQIAVDTIAYAYRLPLQIFDLDAARNFRTHLLSHAKNEPDFLKSEESFAAYANDISRNSDAGMIKVAEHGQLWQNAMPAGDVYLWPLSASFANPIIRLFRGNWPWRWWELIWAFRTLGENTVEFNRIVSFPGSLEDHFSVVPARLNSTARYILVAGPCWKITKDRGNRSTKVAKSFVSSVDKAWQGDRFGRRAKFRSTRLTRMAFGRKSVTESDLIYRAQQAGNALDLTAQIIEETGIPSSRVCLEQIVTIAAFLRSDWQQQVSGLTCQEFAAELSDGTTSFVVNETDGSENDNTEVSRDLGRALREMLIEAVDGIKLKAVGEKGDQLISIFSRFSDQVHSEWHAYNEETYTLVRSWLNDRSGDESNRDTDRAKNRDNSEVNSRAATERPNVDKTRTDYRARPSYNMGDRSARKAAHLSNADCAIIYRADYVRKFMVVFGEHGLGETGSVRKEISFDDLSPNQDASFKQQIVCMGGEDEGRSEMVAPIIHLGHTWGLLQIFGSQDQQFKPDHRGSFAELASIFASHFYSQSMARGLSKIRIIGADPDLSVARRIEEICNVLPHIFLCPSVALHLPSNLRATQLLPFTRPQRADQVDEKARIRLRYLDYFVRAYVDRPDLSTSDKPNMFVRYDPSSISARILNEELRDVESGVIGEGLFGDEWLSRNNRIVLSEKGFQSVCIAAIKMQEADGYICEAFGTITLMSKVEGRFSDAWTSLMPSLTAEIANVLEPLFSESTFTVQILRELGHELNHISNAITHAANQLRGRQITDYSDQLEGIVDEKDIEDATVNMHDLSARSRSLAHFANFMQFGNFDIGALISDGARMLLSRSLEDKEPPQHLSIKSEFENNFFPEGEKGDVEIEWTGGPNYHGPDKVLMHRENLVSVFRILGDNAVKYSTTDDPIKAYIREFGSSDLPDEGVFLVIGNRGQPLAPGERERIFDDTYRSAWAEASNIDGEGRGLGYARDLMRVYGGDVFYGPSQVEDVAENAGPDRPSTIDNTNDVWHYFSVKFPWKLF